MSYTKHNFVSGDTLLASDLNSMEDQIAENEQTGLDLKSALSYNGIGNSFDGVLHNGYWNENGVLVNYANLDVCNLNKIPCVKGDSVVVVADTTVTDPTYYISYLDDTQRIARHSGTGTAYTGTAPAGAKYVCFTFEKSGIDKATFGTVGVYINNAIDALRKQVSEKADDGKYEYKATNDLLKDGRINGGTGEISGTAFSHVDIDVTGYTNIEFYGLLIGNSTPYGYAFYNADGLYLSGAPVNYTKKYNVSIPDNAKYFRYGNNKTLWTDENRVFTLLSESVETLNGLRQFAYLKNVVFDRNSDCNMRVDASAFYGIRKSNVEWKKKFAMLIMTDVHGFSLNVNNFVEYLNNMASLDCGINLGDTAAGYFDENDGSWYTDIINTTKKPIYTVIGNHDIWPSSLDASIGATAQAAYDKWIAPTTDEMGIDPGHAYYYAQYDSYKIALIVLNSYDTPNNTIVNGQYKTRRDLDAWTQAQADWFVSTLNSIPTGYHLIVALHDFPNANGNVTVVECDWSEPGTYAIAPSNGNVNIGSAIEDTINAWINGGTLSRTYPVSTSYPDLWDAADFSPITINADFTQRGAGIFATYLIGHNHHDGIDIVTAYPNQHISMFTTSSADGYQAQNTDLPRVIGTKTEDALSTIAIDTENRTVRLVRIGSTFTTAMTEREFYKFSY